MGAGRSWGDKGREQLLIPAQKQPVLRVPIPNYPTGSLGLCSASPTLEQAALAQQPRERMKKKRGGRKKPQLLAVFLLPFQYI